MDSRNMCSFFYRCIVLESTLFIIICAWNLLNCDVEVPVVHTVSNRIIRICVATPPFSDSHLSFKSFTSPLLAKLSRCHRRMYRLAQYSRTAQRSRSFYTFLSVPIYTTMHHSTLGSISIHFSFQRRSVQAGPKKI